MRSSLGRLSQIVVHHFAEAERKVGADVDGGHDFDNRQFGDRRQSMRGQA
jgi:hypothetical protein